MYKLQTRIDVESERWDDVIDVKFSKTKKTVKIFFTEEDAIAYAKNNIKTKSDLYRVEKVNDEPIS
jgi:hypothetical protein